MNDPFSAHGIDHLSPSSINLFATSPALWVMERLLKISAPVGASAHRGTAAEDGIVAGLLDPGKAIDECVEIALKRYRNLSALCGDHNKGKEGAAIPQLVINGIEELRPYGIPTRTQVRVETTLDGVCVPVIGFADLVWDESGIVIDIKTQLKLSSSIKSSHARQVSLYNSCISDNFSAFISYVSNKKEVKKKDEKKVHTFILENSREHLNALRLIALTMQRFCALSHDPKELAALVAPDTDHFFVNNPITRQHVFETYGY